MTKLLLVEDDNNLREIYEARLQAEGYTIVSARDGEEALVVAKAEKPDLIISDVMMPKISGFEMLDILRNTDELKAVKVIMLTALGQNDDQQRADKLGADRYLVKSQVTLEDIVKVTHELLGDAESTPQPESVTPIASSAGAAAAPADPVPVAPAPAAATPDPVSDAPSSDTSAQSTAQEEAAVEARIEDFVAGATDEPQSAGADTPAPATETPPVTAAPEPTPEPEMVVATEPVIEPPKPDPAEVAAADDKLVDDAVDTLIASTSETTPEPAAPTPISVTTPDARGEPADNQTDSEAEVPPQTRQKVGGERIIEPLDGQPKKNLDALLAIEEANEAKSQSAPVSTATIADNKTGAQQVPITPAPPATPAPGVDPNSIAL